jgi:hypothetical protein
MKNGNRKSVINFIDWFYSIPALHFLNRLKTKFRRTADWQVWKTIEIGTHGSIEALKKAIEGSGGEIDGFARNMFEKVRLAKHITKLELVKVTPLQLGCKNNVQYQTIMKAGLSKGLELCPAEVGPQLHRQYADMPEAECIHVAMEPINLFGGALVIFVLENCIAEKNRQGGRYIRRGSAVPESEHARYPGNTVFVFVKPSLKK